MKKIIAITLAALALPVASHAANTCTNPEAVMVAKRQLANTLNVDDFSQLKLNNIESHTLYDGTPVCTGHLYGENFSTTSVWNVYYMAGEPIVTVISAVDPNHLNTGNSYEDMQKRNAYVSQKVHEQYQQNVEYWKQQSKPSLGKVIYRLLGG